MSNYTDSLGLEEITPGSQAGLWGDTTNNNLALIDQAIAGVTPISFAAAGGTTKTLTDYNGASDEARAAVLNITGLATSSNTIIVPNKQKTYLVRNDTGQDVVFQTASPGATYAVGAGYSILIFCDGNNGVYTGIAAPSVGTLLVSAGGTGVSTFGSGGFIKSAGGTANLTSSTYVALASDVSGYLPVANGGTGQTSLTSGAVLVGNGTGSVGVVVPGTTDYVLTSNGPGSTPSFRAPSSASYPGAGIAVSTGSAWTTSYSSGNPIPVSLGGTGATSLAAAGIATTSSLSSYAPLSGATFSGAVSATSMTTGSLGTTGGIVSTGGYITSQYAGYASIGQNSVVLYNTNTGMYHGGSNFGWQANSTTIATLLNGGSFYCLTGTYGTLSDARAKENIAPARSYLTDLCKLEVVKYSLKSEKSTTPTKIGFVAQQVETVMPGLIETAPDKDSGIEDYKSIKTTVLIPMLVQAIQELKAEVDSLKAQLGAK